MSRIIITHVGTSTIRSGAMEQSPPADYQWRQEQLRADRRFDDSTKKAWRDHLLKVLLPFWKNAVTDQTNHLDKSPAEIASLSFLMPIAADRVILLHSDTADGELCAALLRDALADPALASTKGFPHCAAEIMPVPHLRIADGTYRVSQPNDFVRNGLASYVEVIWNIFNNRNDAQQLIFNITGGYKGMIPIARDLAGLLGSYTRTMGQGLHTELCYLYENSAALISYTSLPILLDWGAIPDTLLERAGDSNGIEIGTLAATHVPLFERVSKSNLRWQRSPLGEVVWSLCQPGRVDYRKISAPERERLQEFYIEQKKSHTNLVEDFMELQHAMTTSIEPLHIKRFERQAKDIFEKITAMEADYLVRLEHLLAMK